MANVLAPPSNNALYTPGSTGGRRELTGSPKDLLNNVRVATEDESAAYFKPDDFRWGETIQAEHSPDGQAVIYINDKKFQDQGVTDYRDKAVLSESLHMFKNQQPEYYEQLLQTAMADPNTQGWLRDSYARETGKQNPITQQPKVRDALDVEKRPFDEWLRESRFDQVIGGYIFAGDEKFPTMKNWSRDWLPFGSMRPDLENMSKWLMP